jgi:hypothetical protein
MGFDDESEFVCGCGSVRMGLDAWHDEFSGCEDFWGCLEACVAACVDRDSWEF